MKTMQTTVNTSAKGGRISDTAAIAAEFSATARKMAESWASPLEKVQNNPVHKSGQSAYSEEEYSLVWGGGILRFEEDGFAGEGFLTFDEEGNLYLGEVDPSEEAPMAYAYSEAVYGHALNKAAKGLFETIKENTLVWLVENGHLSFNEMGTKFRYIQGVWFHSKRVPTDLAKKVASLLGKVGTVGTSESRKAFRRLCALKKELLG